MAKYDVFLNHNSQDKPAVEALARRLVKEGIQPWLDTWNLIPGEPWQEAIEGALDSCATCAVCLGPSGTGPWQNEEMRAAIQRRVDERRAGERPFRVIPVLLPGAERGERSRLPAFLVAATWVEFRRTLDEEDAFHRLVCGIQGVEPGPGPGQAVYEGECPYRGLRVFDVQHAPFFFGREALTEWLLDSLRGDNRFLAVIGPSGSGKSSLARAGLVAALKRGGIEGSEAWPIVICRPGPNPLESLAVAMAGVNGVAQTPSAVRDLMHDLHEDERMLHLTARLALRGAPSERLLALLVDQFEEVFTLCHDEVLRQALVDNLLYAAGAPEGQTVVLLTLRADFYGKCVAYPRLADALSDHQVLVGPMTDGELRRAIERPAHLAGCEFEMGLVERLLADVGDQPGSLPLLQHALLELWARREGRRLTHAAYEEIGGVEGALERRADAVYAQFTEAEKKICRRVFLRLTQPGEGTEDTKRRASLRELLPADGEREAVETVVQTLAGEEARLVTTEGEEAREGEPFIEVAHEALIRNWSRLQEWIDEDRAGLRIHRRLNETATEWEKNRHDESFLFRGTRLTELEAWAEAHASDMNPFERKFVKASIEARDAARIASRRRLIWVITGLTTAVIILAWLTWTAFQERSNAFKAEAVALSRQLVAQASVKLNEDPELALLLSLEAWQQAQREGVEFPLGAEATLRQALTDHHLRRSLFLRAPDVDALAFNSDGTLLATASSSYAIEQEKVEIKVWNVLTGQPVGSFSTLRQEPLLNFCQHNEHLVVSSRATLEVWDVTTGAKVAQFKSNSAPIRQAACSQNGRHIITLHANWWQRSDFGQILSVWSLERQTLEWELSAPVVALSANGERAALIGSDGTVQVWDILARHQVFTISSQSLRHSPEDFLPQVILNFDGTFLAIKGPQSIEWWDLDKCAALPPVPAEAVQDMILSANGRRLALVYDRRVELYGSDANLLGKVDFDVLNQGPSEWGSHTAPSSGLTKLAVNQFDRRTVWLWDFNEDRMIAEMRGHTDNISHMTFSPDGSTLATGGSDGTVRLWDTTGKTGQHWLTLGGHQNGTRQMAFDPIEEALLATVSQQGVVSLWDLVTGDRRTILHGSCVAFHPKRHVLAVGDRHGSISLWDISTGSTIAMTVGHPNTAVDFLAFSLDGAHLFSASNGENSLRAWNVEAVTEMSAVTFEGAILTPSSSGRRHVIAVDGEKNPRLWDAFEGEVTPFDCPVAWGVAFHPNEDVVVGSTPDDDYTLPVCSTVTGRHLFSLEAEGEDIVLNLAFDASGDRLAALTWQGAGIASFSVELWDFKDRQHIARFDARGQGEPLLSAFGLSPDGQRIIWAFRQGDKPELWDVTSGAIVGHLSPHEGEVSLVQFSPACITLPVDGKQQCVELVATAGKSHSVIVDFVNPEDLTVFACARVTRNLTAGEWLRYIGNEPYNPTCPDAPIPEDVKEMQ